jgi:uncharacterized Zn finger protein
MMSWYEFRPYVPVAKRRRQAQKEVQKLKKKGQPVAPVVVEGRTIARSFWGKAWCTNLERYSDFASRLPRGRTYLRNGSVLDLQIAKGKISALVSGSKLYKIKIDIVPVDAKRWKSICRDCSGTIDSLIELLQGRLAKGVMDRVCREGDGLFPAPDEIKLSCSCPDWADMCKHVAAALYGVGARLDEQPRLLFTLRDVDESELIASAGPDVSLATAAPASAHVLDESDISSIFGLEIAEPPAGEPAADPRPTSPAKTAKSKPPNGRSRDKTPVGRAKIASAKDKMPREAPAKLWTKPAGRPRATKAPATDHSK